ncbi:MAG TPA: outer membrane beta-barrel protein [Vicinamibacterales bacterium]|nr:outer membrane beta-barrel protein [Vicinamibacterales bacterium]
MPFGTLLLVTATLAAPSASSPAAAPKLVATLNASSVEAQRATSTTPQQTERPHQFGIGGSVTASTRGAAGDVRYWFSDHIGLNMTAGWYRSYYETSNGQRPSAIHASPSIIYLIGKPNYTREVDIRPFVGGGPSYLRARRPVVSPTGNILMSEASGTGMHAFGGAEITFKEAEQVALSAELIYYRLPVRLSNRSSLDGLNYLVAVHFYLK